MEQFSQIRDKISLRQKSIEIATKTLQYIHTFNSNISYDINNHLEIAKAIEKYIEGDYELPEYVDPYKEILDHFKTGLTSNSIPNFKVNSEEL